MKIITYREMCNQEGVETIQRGMNFNLQQSYSVVLMSTRPGSPYKDSESIEHTRIIPSHIIQEVWKRDKGKCVICHKENNLHYDHYLPFSKGGSSITSDNIRILCSRHNLEKSNKIV